MSGLSVPLVETLLAHADAHPLRPAIVGSGESVTYGDLSRRVLSSAARIAAAIGGCGERVVLCGPNSSELAVAYFAVHVAGGVAVLLDADAPADAIRAAIDDSGARLVLLSKSVAERGTSDMEWPDHCASSESLLVQDLAEATRADEGPPLFSPRAVLSEPADLLYTTGTTGRRKGVLLTHENVAQAAVNINAFIGTTPDDREIVPLPLAHSFGLGRLRVMAHVGHSLLLSPGMRNPAALLLRLLESRATGLALVPAGFDLLLRMTRDRLADARDHLRYIEIGSAAMPLATRAKLAALLPRTRICHHYGLTEASRAAFLEYHADCERLSSIGRPSPNVEMAVLDDDGRDLPDDRQGQLVVRGRMVMRGYWKQPELTREVLHHGWLRTGDRGWRDTAGYYHLTGRQSDIVNVGGRKVSPEEVEEALNAHPAVIESACAGVSDPQGIVGECLKACVVLRSDVRDEQLIDWLRGRLEEYKIPRVWQRVEHIPRTPSGKIQRHLL